MVHGPEDACGSFSFEIGSLPSVFPSEAEAISLIKEACIAQGFQASIIQKDAKKQRTFLGCHRGGSYRCNLNKESKKDTGTQKVNCTFKLIVKGLKSNDSIVWTWHISNKVHNHAPCEDLRGLPAARRLSQQNTEKTINLYTGGVAPEQILSTIRSEDKRLIVNGTFTICCRKIGRRRMQAVLQRMY